MMQRKIDLKGYLYRKFKEKKKRPSTRAGMLLDSLKKNYPESEFPKFVISPNTGLITLPRTTEINIKSVTYPLITPYAYANIRYDEAENILAYNVMEPTLSEFEENVFTKVKEGLVQIIDISLTDIQKPGGIFEFLEKNIRRLLNEYNFKLTQKEYLKVMYYVYRDFVGLNKIEPLMNDPYVEDIGCDGMKVPIYVVHQRFGSLRTNIIYNNEEELREFVIKLAERADRYISYAEPLLDGTLRDG
ncbi:MAG: hypothetical protein NT120_03180, partial [Candidatus Aenigmarchaeota archaeon]|nr:hypothetical protein [Candidatus Aenigmarchaeota archaeon]